MRNAISILIVVLGVICGAYVGLWLMFISPILTMCAAFDAGTLSAMIVGVSVIKMLLASFVGWIIVYVSIILAKIVAK